jgi:hypothetical protein
MRSLLLPLFAGALLIACLGDGKPLLEGYTGGGADTGTSDTSGSTGLDAPGDSSEGDTEDGGGAECTWPETGTGFSVGDVFSPTISLRDCDGSERILGELMCGHKLTLIDLSAGWCEPCKEQAEDIDEEIYEPYKDQGLQVVSIIFQSEDSGIATSQTCAEWRDAFELTSPVLTDPFFNLNGGVKAMFDAAGGAAPVNMLVDESFQIRYVHSGEKPVGLEGIIEELLAE